MPPATHRDGVAAWDWPHVVSMAVAWLITCWIMTRGLAALAGRADDLLGGMWAVLATIFVFRETRSSTMSAGASRLLATCVSFALCLAYLVILPFTAVAMAILIGLGSVIMLLLDRSEDVITTAITTIVVMVAPAISPHDAWQQPLLRLLDTIVGIAVGVTGKWAASSLFSAMAREPAR